ncbi:MAG TPA: hypothetical protein VHB78_15350 [Vicinamibacterales bacterium]|jgi:hypothetical protein|nr:hypothetical protein [Vicinamibacterales bacterium]
MGRLNVFVDGTWLLHQCSAGGSLANATDDPDHRFVLDFGKLNSALVDHVRSAGSECDGIGDAYISTSIFHLPADFAEWPQRFDDVSSEQIEKVQYAVKRREDLVALAERAGYLTDAVYRPPIRNYIIRRLSEGKYQEKQVDTSVVALLVKSAITRGDDHHAVITGDSDILPAVRVAYPAFTRNVFVVTTHPDELNPSHRQTAFSLVDFAFDVPPFFMQAKENAVKILAGEHVHRCHECGVVFAMARPVPRGQLPRCGKHRPPPAGERPQNPRSGFNGPRFKAR